MSQGDNNDKFLRQKQKQKDKDLSQQLQKEMKLEQQMLRDYFKEYKKPVQEDPTIVRKKKQAQTEDKGQIYKQVFKPFKMFSMFYDFWNMQCQTDEQKYALKLAKDNIKYHVLLYVGASLMITSLTSYKTRMYIGWPLHIFGFVTAIASGTTLGIINSTQFTLQQFQKLGQGYQLGRMAITQIQKYRMDKTV